MESREEGRARAKPGHTWCLMQTTWDPRSAHMRALHLSTKSEGTLTHACHTGVSGYPGLWPGPGRTRALRPRTMGRTPRVQAAGGLAAQNISTTVGLRRLPRLMGQFDFISRLLRPQRGSRSSTPPEAYLGTGTPGGPDGGTQVSQDGGPSPAQPS